MRPSRVIAALAITYGIPPEIHLFHSVFKAAHGSASTPAQTSMPARERNVGGASAMLGIWIGRPIDHSRNPGFNDGVGARWRPTLSRAGLERYVEGSAMGSLACSSQSLDFGVVGSSCSMPAPCDDSFLGHYYGAHGRVWVGGTHTLARLTDRLAHEFFICRHRVAASASSLLQSIENLS